MCLSIPGKISKIDKIGFEIDYGKEKVKIVNSLVNGLKVGDWVLVQNRFIINRLDKKEFDMFFKNLNLKGGEDDGKVGID